MDVHTTTTEEPAAKAPPVPRNGVDTPKLFATIGAVASRPAIGQFRFRAESKWEGGTQSRSTIAGFYGVGAEMQHDMPFQALADHPKVLCGEDNAPAPVEWVLHALAACLTAGIANSRAEVLRWAVGRIREHPAYAQLQERIHEIDELKAQF